MDEELQTEEVVQEEEQHQEAEIEKAPAEETVEETIAKSISELKQAEGSSEEEQEKPKKSAKSASTTVDAEEEEEEKEIPVPNDWSAKGKEAFKKYDKVAQAELSRLSKEYQAYRQREINNFITQKKQFEQEKNHFKSVTDTVTRFLPHWGKQGITPEAAMSEVCAFYTQFMTDPAGTIEDMARAAGLKVQVAGARQKENVDPRINSLTEELSSIKNLISSSQAQAIDYQVQALGQQIDEEYESLRDEEAQPGRYKYPDLHNPQFCKKYIEPLVTELARANPEEANWGELIKRAYIASGGRVIPSNSPTRLNGTRSTTAARRASASVSGIGGGAPDAGTLPFIPNESVEDTIRRTKAMLSSR